MTPSFSQTVVPYTLQCVQCTSMLINVWDLVKKNGLEGGRRCRLPRVQGVVERPSKITASKSFYIILL